MSRHERANSGTFTFGIVGPGEIADVFASAIVDADVARVGRILGRRRARAEAFATVHCGRVVHDYGALLDPDGEDAVDALYVATPHTFHARAVEAALEAGVPVLCEKPLTTDPVATEALHARAHQRGVVLMDAWMYRAHPQVRTLLERVRDGAIGTVQRIEAEFSFHAPFDPTHRLYDPALGGGAILDVGGYPMSFAVAVARAALGIEPHELAEAPFEHVIGRVAPSGVDSDARARVRFGEVVVEAEASIRCADLSHNPRVSARVIGTEGVLSLEEPWCPEGERRGRRGVLIHTRGGESERVVVGSEHDCYGLEAAHFVDLVRRSSAGGTLGSPPWPLVDAPESIAIARLCDRWRRAVLAAAAPDARARSRASETTVL